MNASKSSKTSGPSSVGFAFVLAVRLARHGWIVPRSQGRLRARDEARGCAYFFRIVLVSMRCAVSIAATVAVATLSAASAYAAPPKGDAEQALRTGRYEQARRLACARAAGARPTDTPTLLLCVKAELALGRTGDARKRLEAAADARPDDLAGPRRADAPLRRPSAIAPRWPRSIDASYGDWNGGNVVRNRARAI